MQIWSKKDITVSLNSPRCFAVLLITSAASRASSGTLNVPRYTVLPGRSTGQHQPGLHQDTEEEPVLDCLRDPDDAVLQHLR